MSRRKIILAIGFSIAMLACQFVSDLPALILTTPTSTLTPTPAFTPTPVVASLDELSYSDRPDDDPDKWMIHVLYVVPEDFTDTTHYFDGSIDESIRLVNEWFFEQTDGKSLAFDMYEGQLDITYVPIPLLDDEIVWGAREDYISGDEGDGQDPFFDIIGEQILEVGR